MYILFLSVSFSREATIPFISPFLLSFGVFYFESTREPKNLPKAFDMAL